MAMTKGARTAIAIFLVIMVLFVAALWWLASQKELVPTFYYGSTCPHCHNVINWLASHNATQSVKMVEVWADKDNAAAFVGVVHNCGMAQAVVPVLVTSAKCYVGDVDILTYLNQTLQVS